MTWHMATSLRIQFVLLSTVLTAVSVYLLVIGVEGPIAFALVLGIILLAVAANIALIGIRSALILTGDTLVIQSALRSKTILRSEITSVKADSGGVSISYKRDGRQHSTVVDAGQGILNSVGGRLFRRETRTQLITDQVDQWCRAPDAGAGPRPTGT